MFWLIFLGIATAAMLVGAGITIGDVISEPEEMRKSFCLMELIPVTVYVISTLMIGWLFCFTLPEYVASHIGYSSSEYQIEKKVIVSSVENCTDKADTLYLFKRK